MAFHQVEFDHGRHRRASKIVSNFLYVIFIKVRLYLRVPEGLGRAVESKQRLGSIFLSRV